MIDAADDFVQILMLFETAIWRCVMLIAHSLSWARGSLAEAGRCASTRYIIVDFTSRDCSVFYCCVSCLSLHGLMLPPILTLGLTDKLWTWTNTCVAYMLYLLATDDCWNMVLFMKYIVFWSMISFQAITSSISGRTLQGRAKILILFIH